MQSRYGIGIREDGSEGIVVVVKASWSLSNSKKKAHLPPEKSLPLIESDIHHGDPGTSAVKHENDFVTFKPRCDVLLLGCAYAPNNNQIHNVVVELRIGDIDKQFRVFGERFWRKSNEQIVISSATPFLKREIDYSMAYGGRLDEENEVPVFMENPIGCGHFPDLEIDEIDGLPAPSTEEIDNPIINPSYTTYRPMSFGVIARNSSPRYQLAGTYDDSWFANVAPLLPDDFNNEYYQSAPRDQQIKYPIGGEEVELINLDKTGKLTFSLPVISLEIEAKKLNSMESEVFTPVIDTIVIEPEENRFTLVWRSFLPEGYDMQSTGEIAIAKASNAWMLAKITGKQYKPLRNLKKI